ncbi:5-oxoprolinase subunit PxpB [Pontibacter toksunensis]|uniref:5-oxoprolinase subunit PxpB n=1 Tax=Pontibacter toksunensis TaxID=1332631 RepID=A0ABW6BZS9_9BACT
MSVLEKEQSEIPAVQLYPLGDAAVVVQFGVEVSEQTHKKVKAFCAYLQQHPFPGLLEFVPAYTTVTVYYNPWVISEKGHLNPYTKVTGFLQRMLPFVADAEENAGPRIVEIPVLYGGEYGPDLEFVARINELSPEEVVTLHTQQEYLVYMVGFAPGFPYLGGMNKRIAAPRRDSPRQHIAAGSVGIAGEQTGIYPIQTPGGWQLIGRTPVSLFNPRNISPSLLQAGDSVRFVAITEEEYKERKEQQHES